MLPPGMPALSGMAPNKDGLAVFGIAEGSMLYRLGLRHGDVLMSVNGQPLTGPSGRALMSPLLQGKPGQAYVLRDGHVVPMTLELAPDPQADAAAKKAYEAFAKKEGIALPEPPPGPTLQQP